MEQFNMAKKMVKSQVPDIFRPEIHNTSLKKHNLNYQNNQKIRHSGKIKKAAQKSTKNFPNTDKTLPDLVGEIEFEFNPAKSKKKIQSSSSSLPIMRGSVKHVSPKRAKFKVVIRKVERPFNNDFEHQLAWICSSLGFFEPIDKEKNAAAVFKEIVLATEKGEALSSTAIAERVGMSRGATINHLNNLLRSGLVEKNGHFYSARSRSVKRTIEEIEEDIEHVFSQLKKTAEELDRQIGFEE